MLTINQAVAYLNSKRAGLPVQTKEALSQGQIEVKDNHFILRKEVNVSSGKVPLLDATTLEVAGVSSFDKNQLKDFINHLISKVRIRYGADAASGKEALIAYTTAPIVALVNANLIISQNNRVLFNMPCASLINPNAGNTVEDDFAKFSRFYMLKSNENISIELEFPTNSVGGGTVDYVEITLGGYTTFQK